MVPPDDPTPSPEAGSGDNSLGFPTEKKRERYNTQFLVANFEKEQRRTRMIVAGVAVLIMVAIGVAFGMSGSKVEPLPNSAATGAMPPQPGVKAPAPAPAPAPGAPAGEPKK